VVRSGRMFLIVGLGNIGKKYEYTRHNIGFDVVDLISHKYNIAVNREKFKGTYGEGTILSEKIILLKPNTYMNLSGESVREIVEFFKIPMEKIIVIYDDISLDIGRLRIRLKGSPGGHNGIKNIIANLGSDVFPRIKVGVGHPDQELVSYVLGRFSKEERQQVERTFEATVEAVECIVKEGLTEAMNRFNSFKI
jgi:PTH1 family peptidyl-tRNA hydrolase